MKEQHVYADKTACFLLRVYSISMLQYSRVYSISMLTKFRVYLPVQYSISMLGYISGMLGYISGYSMAMLSANVDLPKEKRYSMSMLSAIDLPKVYSMSMLNASVALQTACYHAKVWQETTTSF